MIAGSKAVKTVNMNECMRSQRLLGFHIPSRILPKTLSQKIWTIQRSKLMSKGFSPMEWTVTTTKCCWEWTLFWGKETYLSYSSEHKTKLSHIKLLEVKHPHCSPALALLPCTYHLMPRVKHLLSTVSNQSTPYEDVALWLESLDTLATCIPILASSDIVHGNRACANWDIQTCISSLEYSEEIFCSLIFQRN
jgi:hypothetical protein